jgi:hypothetical protein
MYFSILLYIQFIIAIYAALMYSLTWGHHFTCFKLKHVQMCAKRPFNAPASHHMYITCTKQPFFGILENYYCLFITELPKIDYNADGC